MKWHTAHELEVVVVRKRSDLYEWPQGEVAYCCAGETGWGPGDQTTLKLRQMGPETACRLTGAALHFPDASRGMFPSTAALPMTSPMRDAVCRDREPDHRNCRANMTDPPVMFIMDRLRAY